MWHLEWSNMLLGANQILGLELYECYSVNIDYFTICIMSRFQRRSPRGACRERYFGNIWSSQKILLLTVQLRP